MWEYAFRVPPSPWENIIVGHRLFGMWSGSSSAAFLCTGIVV